MTQPPRDRKNQRGDAEQHADRNGQQRKKALFERFEDIGDRADKFFVNAEDRRNRAARKAGNNKRHADRRAARYVGEKPDCTVPLFRGNVRFFFFGWNVRSALFHFYSVYTRFLGCAALRSK